MTNRILDVIDFYDYPSKENLDKLIQSMQIQVDNHKMPFDLFETCKKKFTEHHLQFLKNSDKV